MNYLGIDVSKDELVIFSDITGEVYSIENSLEAIRSFFLEHLFDEEETIIGCESTADYHLPVCSIGLELGYKTKAINPIITRGEIKATIRNKKTDKSDAQIIVKALKDKQGEFITEEFLQKSKRTILRTQSKIVECTSDLKRIKKSLQKKAKVMDVQESLEAIERCIEFLSVESKELTSKATQNPDKQEKIIDSVPGCGLKLSAIISTEAGDITRFPAAKQFKAYAGIDPKVSQSGNSSYTGRMTKRGNPRLRQALYLAANVARQYDPPLTDFYDKKRSEGKSHRHATCAVARKLCERIYAIVTKGCFYQINTT